MSIITRTGDDGTTALMYGRRVPKSHPRVEAYGCVDELNAALGMARATAAATDRKHLADIQKDLIIVMGELATEVADLPRFIKDGYSLVTPDLTSKIDRLARKIEADLGPLKGWATPGGTLAAAALDVARTICRRAERRVCALHEAGRLQNAEIIVFLNRLSDCLWLLARQSEQRDLKRRGSRGKSKR